MLSLVDSHNVDSVENYYTVRQVAEIKGISKQAIIEGCKSGKYPGSKKVDSNISPNGIWLIPKNIIDIPVVVKDVAVTTRQIAPQELQNMVESAIREELGLLRNEISELRKENTELKREILEEIKTLGSRIDKHKKNNSLIAKFFFWR